MKYTPSLALTLSACTLALASTAVWADTIKVSGASTVFNVVLKPTQSKVEKDTGHTLEVLSSNTGKGLADLANGQIDMAMVSEPMDIAVAAAEQAGKQIDPKTLKFFEVKKDEIVFVVHPSNPVTKLSWEQIRDIETGKIKNWKDVGGKDQAITVYAGGPTDGTTNMIKKIVMGGQALGADAKAQASIKRVAEVVAGDESAFGGIGKGFVEAGKLKVLQSKKLERPLGFTTLGTPKPAVKQVIDAFTNEAKSL
jgi:phosphate transport system substrate-binding protein